MFDMNIRPGGPSGLQLAYAVGRFEGEDDAFVLNQLGGESPLGSTLCCPGSDYAVFISPDGAGRSVLAGLDITSPRGDGKAWYLRDSETGAVWSPFFLPSCQPVDELEVSYLPGRISVHSLKHKIACTLTIGAIPGNSCEIWRVKIENRSASNRTLTFTAYAEPCIGPELESGYVDQQKTLMMGRPLSAVAAGDQPVRDMVIFMSSTLTPIRFETDKGRFIGDGRTLRNPAHLDNDAQCGEDGLSPNPAASLTVEINVPIEGEAEFAFCFGVASSAEEAIQTARAFSCVNNVNAALESALGAWQDLCSTVRVRSQDGGFDALVNTWLPYEAYAGWIGQRTAGVCLDPSRAADALRRMYALSATAPEETRNGLLRFASGVSLMGGYSPEGDSMVMLPSAELLWLAACTARYVAETGDTSLLAEEIASHAGPRLTLREHCERAVRMCLADGKAPDRLIRRTVRLWSLVDESTPEFGSYLDSLSSRRRVEGERDAESHSLPRRVRYFQSVTPVLSDGVGAEELASVFGSETSPDGDSGTACCIYSILEETILGLEATPQGLRIRPRLPDQWQECDIRRVFRDDIYVIRIRRALQSGKSGTMIVVDGEPVLGDMLPYVGDGMEHRVEVVLS